MVRDRVPKVAEGLTATTEMLLMPHLPVAPGAKPERNACAPLSPVVSTPRPARSIAPR